MSTIHIKKIKQSMLCVTGVYLRDITDLIFVFLHLNVVWAFTLLVKCVSSVYKEDRIHRLQIGGELF